jgi:O-antigen ligase
MSRGGTLALVASFVYYWAFIMKRKSAGVGLLATGLGVVLLLAPPAYFDRLGTIQNYEADNSAMSRLQVWRAGMKMAVDYPLGVGGGNFSSAYGRYYIPDAEQNVMTYKKRKWMSAHSVYFKLLGEYGIIGVLWLLTLLVTNVRDNAASRERLTLQSLPDAPAAEWPLFINMSLVGYAVSGVFLGGLTYPYLYLLSGLTASAVGQSVWTTVPRGAGVERESVASGSNGTSLQTTARDREALRRQSVTDRARIAMSSRRRAS